MGEWLHQLVFKQTDSDVSPYAYVTRLDVAGKRKATGDNLGPPQRTGSECWCENADGKSKPGGGREKPAEKWHWHTMQRKQMQSEFDDAFKLRRWVVMVLLFGMLGVLCAAWLCMRWIWSYL